MSYCETVANFISNLDEWLFSKQDKYTLLKKLIYCFSNFSVNTSYCLHYTIVYSVRHVYKCYIA